MARYKRLNFGGPGGVPKRFNFDKSRIVDEFLLNEVIAPGAKRMSDFGGTQGTKSSTSGSFATTSNTTTDAPSGGIKKVFSTASDIVNAVKPYASNIANSFSRAPKPKTPRLIKPVTLSKINLDGSRNAIVRNTRGADVMADRTLDEQTAAAVRAANLGTKIAGMNDVNEREALANANQQSQAAQINSNIDAMNTGAMNNFQDNLVNNQIVNRREQSQNFANAIDKSIAIDNEKGQRDLDLKKFGILSEMYKGSGVMDRWLESMKKRGNSNPTGIGRYGGKLRMLAMGGPGDPKPGSAPAPDPIKLAQANAEAKRFAVSRGLISGENTHTGGVIPQYIDAATGKPYVPTPAKKLAMSLPSGMRMEDIKSDGNAYWYEDPYTNDIVDVNPGTVFHKFPKLKPQMSETREVVTNMRGKLKKIF